MLLAALMTTLLAPAPPAVTIYVGPVVREGFVDTDNGVRDSVSDLRVALATNKGLRVVPSEAGADLKLYVIGRQKGAGPTAGVGVLSHGSGTSISGPSTTFALETRLVVGAYERTMTAELNRSTDWHVTWGKLARNIAKDLSTWLAANHERVARKE